MNVRKISLLALFIALSVVGAAIKIPAIIGSIALDAFPALFAAAFFGAGPGAIVGGLGHLVSAVIGGMSMGLLHFLVALEMALLCAIFAIFYKRGKRMLAGIIFLVGNAFIAPLPFILIFDVAFFLAIVPSLFIGSLLNTVIALVTIPRLQSIFQGAYFKAEAKG